MIWDDQRSWLILPAICELCLFCGDIFFIPNEQKVKKERIGGWNI
jgi:hypothetical protein